MTTFEHEFEKTVNAVRFDDTPRQMHRRQLEQQLLETYDQRSQQPAVSLSGFFYVRRAAIAAGFVIAAGLLVWCFNDSGSTSNGQPAHTPDPRTIERILTQAKVSGAQRQALLSEIQQVWKLIAAQDLTGLTTVVLDEQAAPSVRNWAGESVVALGTEETLGKLENYCQVHTLTDPDNPVVHAAQQLRKRLESPPQNDE